MKSGLDMVDGWWNDFEGCLVVPPPAGGIDLSPPVCCLVPPLFLTAVLRVGRASSRKKITLSFILRVRVVYITTGGDEMTKCMSFKLHVHNSPRGSQSSPEYIQYTQKAEGRKEKSNLEIRKIQVEASWYQRQGWNRVNSKMLQGIDQHNCKRSWGQEKS
jgi:hypothetical protein